MSLSPKLEQSMTQAGGRHYRGASPFGATGAWVCPACGNTNAGDINLGCQHCPAGRNDHPPERRQASKPVDARIPARGLNRDSRTVADRQAPSAAQQLRQRTASPAMSQEFAALVADVVVARLQQQQPAAAAQFSLVERRTLVEALGALQTLITDGVIDPPPGILDVERIGDLASHIESDTDYTQEPAHATPETDPADQDRPGGAASPDLRPGLGGADDPGGPDSFGGDEFEPEPPGEPT